MTSQIFINDRCIGVMDPAYIIAEMSANHGQSKEKAKEIIYAMKESGADAVKLQTYTPDTITLNCNNKYFVDCLKGTIWEGKSLYELYGEAFTPWEWQPELKELAESLGMDCFSTAFDETSVDFLEKMNVPAYKVASFELVHLPLIRRMAATGKPLIMSTGMATLEEIQEALEAASNASGIIILKCTSAYPAKISDANVRAIPAMAKEFDLPVGLSDHTLGSVVPIAAVSQGACVIEKHFILDRERDKNPDSAFSMEPKEFRAMVDAVRAVERDPSSAVIDERALGTGTFGSAEGEKRSAVFRPSIFVVRDIAEGEQLTAENVKITRPWYGLKPKHFDEVIGKCAVKRIDRGTPLTLDMIS